MKSILSCLFFIGWIGCLHAQSSTSEVPVPPPGPLIQKRAPDFAKWTVTVSLDENAQGQSGTASPSGGSSPNNAPSKKITTKKVITKTRDVIHVEFTDEDGRVWNLWDQGSLHAFIWPDGKTANFAAPSLSSENTNFLYLDFSNSDFDGFDWISASNYKGIKEVAGKSCLVFEGIMEFGGLPMKANAAIDLATRLPVQSQGPTGVVSYEFSDPPAEMQAIPSSIERLMFAQLQKEKSLARRPGAAF
jgi:hypothetical protein